MHCPRDQSELTVRDTEGHIGFLCSKCKGAWLPSKYVQSIEYMRVFSYREFIDQLAKSASLLSAMRCPSGCGKLSEVTLRQMTLYRCNTCQGMWFDHGEIRRLLAQFELRERSMGEAVAEQAGWSVLAGILGGLLS
jgi:Zn-finger nucleic acid-binding protein